MVKNAEKQALVEAEQEYQQQEKLRIEKEKK